MKRRRFIWGLLTAGCGAAVAALISGRHRLEALLADAFNPKVLFEPSNVASIGRLSDFTMGVHKQFLKERRIYVVRNSERLYVLYASCTHQGCTPDWAPQEHKFRCLCHGSGFCLGSSFDGDGLNCGGPAPRPLDRVHVELNRSGDVIVNVGKLYQWPKGGRSEFDDPGAYIPLEQS